MAMQEVEASTEVVKAYACPDCASRVVWLRDGPVARLARIHSAGCPAFQAKARAATWRPTARKRSA
jgi:hypothetical protein